LQRYAVSCRQWVIYRVGWHNWFRYLVSWIPSCKVSCHGPSSSYSSVFDKFDQRRFILTEEVKIVVTYQIASGAVQLRDGKDVRAEGFFRLCFNLTGW
jgi:hypothetical protein